MQGLDSSRGLPSYQPLVSHMAHAVCAAYSSLTIENENTRAIFEEQGEYIEVETGTGAGTGNVCIYICIYIYASIYI
jgi:hypothetical protein